MASILKIAQSNEVSTTTAARKPVVLAMNSASMASRMYAWFPVSSVERWKPPNKVRSPLALNQVLTDLSGMRKTAEKIGKYMKTIPAKQLTMLVSHFSNIQSITGVNLSSGEMVVVHIDASGAMAVDGRIMVS